MTKVILFSGRKQSGKSTSGKFLFGSALCSLGILQAFRFAENGDMEVLSNFGSEDGQPVEGVLDPASQENQEFLSQLYIEEFDKTADQFVRSYSFADDLKQKVCIDLLGLTHEQCYGSDEQKNSLTNLRWEDMPGVITPENQKSGIFPYGICHEDAEILWNGSIHASGAMTAREVMQFVGTKIFRKMYSNVWVDATIRKIKKDQPDIALISDCRFVNEVEAFKVANDENFESVSIRLLRQPHEDNDASETALDDYKDFDCIIDNRDTTIKETNALIEQYLRSISWFPEYILPVNKQ